MRTLWFDEIPSVITITIAGTRVQQAERAALRVMGRGRPEGPVGRPAGLFGCRDGMPQGRFDGAAAVRIIAAHSEYSNALRLTDRIQNVTTRQWQRGRLFGQLHLKNHTGAVTK